ncbi:hypothetical protein T439DRAFT_334735 [Meredithblackwellia eburnea MCA 4105]
MAKVLLPGDPLPSTSAAASTSAVLHLGPGLHAAPTAVTALNGKGKSKEDVTAVKAGLLGFHDDGKAEKWWIESLARRYVPHPPEPVIGIIIARHAEGYRVDIGSSQAASLDALSFEASSFLRFEKYERPHPYPGFARRKTDDPFTTLIQVGTLVYAHLLSTPPFSEPEISCVDAATQKSAGFGELVGGFPIRGVELNRCRALLSPKNPILAKLGAQFPFEVAVGMNGRIWVKAADGEEENLVKLIQELRGRP